MNVIFVCTGNTCRSPLAEILARKMAAERGITGLTFSSAGIAAFTGSPATDPSILIAIERGTDLSLHRARAFTPSLVDDNTIVLTMTPSHLTEVLSIAPHAKAYLLDAYASRGAHRESVDDPFGGDLAAYRVAADEIETMLAKALDRLAAEQTPKSR